MEQLLERIRDGLTRGAYPNERAVSTSIVVPILRALGWDDSDPEQVLPEHSTGRGRVDYALRCPPRPPIVFIEVKNVGRSGDADRQLFKYAFHEGVPLAILTDGREWSFYLPAEQGSYDDRRVYQLVLDERDVSESKERLQRYLDRDRLSLGTAIDAARHDYRDARSRREASATLSKAWTDLLAEPDGLIVDLLLNRTEALCGYRPNQDEAEHYIREQVKIGDDNSTVRASFAPIKYIVPNTKRQDTSYVLAGLSSASWRVRSQSGTARKAVDAFASFLDSIFSQFPERTEHIVAAARTRSRANIANTPSAIYPSRPDLGEKSSRRLANGMYLGTNLSNAEKLKLAKQVASAVGLTFGLDANLECNP